MYLEGTIQTRKWTGNDGIEKYTTEVVIPRFNGVMTMLDGRSGGGGGGGYDSGSGGGGGPDAPDWDSPDSGGGAGGGGADLDDEIPF